MSSPLIDVDGLTVRFGRAEPVVRDVSFTVADGECVALVGESGSGKSVTARTLLGLAGADARVQARTLAFAGRSLLSLAARQWRGIRGGGIALVLQDALVALDPLRPVGREIDDTLRLHTRLGPAARRRRMLELLDQVGLPDPARVARLRADELSGGMRQRALVAAAVAAGPAAVIADEPTTALDSAVQRRVLELLGRLRETGTAVLLISHDLGVVSGLADRVHVMSEGRVVEAGTTEAVLHRPQHPYTRRLLAAVPRGRARGQRLLVEDGDVPGPPAAPPATAPAVLELAGVTKAFTAHGATTTAVAAVDLRLSPGRTLGLIGASGSGKTTTARLALGLEEPDAGRVLLDGTLWNPLPERQRRSRRGLLGAVYQDPYGSFDPRFTVGRLLADALSGGRTTRPAAVGDHVAAALAEVGLDPALAARHTRALSGGQRQRVAIARALAASPRALVLDEPVASLDVTVQAQVLDLLDRLQRERGLAYLFITHDLDVVRHMSDELAVMDAGRIVEHGATEAVFAAPAHPFTRALLQR